MEDVKSEGDVEGRQDDWGYRGGHSGHSGHSGQNSSGRSLRAAEKSAQEGGRSRLRVDHIKVM